MSSSCLRGPCFYQNVDLLLLRSPRQHILCVRIVELASALVRRVRGNFPSKTLLSFPSSRHKIILLHCQTFVSFILCAFFVARRRRRCRRSSMCSSRARRLCSRRITTVAPVHVIRSAMDSQHNMSAHIPGWEEAESGRFALIPRRTAAPGDTRELESAVSVPGGVAATRRTSRECVSVSRRGRECEGVRDADDNSLVPAGDGCAKRARRWCQTKIANALTYPYVLAAREKGEHEECVSIFIERIRQSVQRRTIGRRRGHVSALTWANISQFRFDKFFLFVAPKGRGLWRRTVYYFR